MEVPWIPPPVMQGRGPHDSPPIDLCPVHRKAWRAWRDHVRRYTSSNPTDWPGGSHIMDSRTTHLERRRGWLTKDAEQMELVEKICRSGKSPECERKPEE